MVPKSEGLITRKRLRFYIILITFLGVGGISLINGKANVRAAVDLRYFRANAYESSVLIEWGTATELDHAGFYVLRSTSVNGAYQKISPFIYAQGDSLTGSDYEYSDTNVASGNTYWYKLESIDTSQRSKYSNPVSVGFKLPTITNTPTLTMTSTPTWTPGVTIISTATVSPSNTPIPTDTIASTITQEIPGQTTESVTEPTVIVTTPNEADLSLTEPALTYTLLPFPTITIEFPTTPILVLRTPYDGYQQARKIKININNDSVSHLFIYIILFLSWILLGFWLYKIIRSNR
jgi:hypothetical protein